jgi:hypothetical protein
VSGPTRPGALVLSLDFELHWGVRDHTAPDASYRRNLLGGRTAVRRMLERFVDAGAAATWAAVGLLFAATRAEREAHAPAVRPRYHAPRLSPYAEPAGEGEADDPLHYAATLVEAIRDAPRQEVATHTFSHFYCLEPGQDREAFRADLASAVSIAAARGVRLESIVFPRNQHNPSYDDLLLAAGIRCYRGNPAAWMYRPVNGRGDSLRMRGARLLDLHLPVAGPHAVPWNRIPQASGLCNVPASRFLRPCAPGRSSLDALRLRRIRGEMEGAARRGDVYHLWWHPHNFGEHPDLNLAFLDRVLDHHARCRDRYGMRSLTMAEAARAAGAR